MGEKPVRHEPVNPLRVVIFSEDEILRDLVTHSVRNSEGWQSTSFDNVTHALADLDSSISAIITTVPNWQDRMNYTQSPRALIEKSDQLTIPRAILSTNTSEWARQYVREQIPDAFIYTQKLALIPRRISGWLDKLAHDQKL